MPDQEVLLAAARGGDRRAFGELVRAHYGRIYASAFHLLGNHEDAEDLAQECFVRAHGALAQYRGESSFIAWLYRIALHLVRDRFRRAQRRPARTPLEEVLPVVPGGGPLQELSGRELGRCVSEAIEALPENLRIALSLRVREGWNYQDLAAATGVSPKTARNRVMKARRALRRVLAPLLDMEDEE